MDVKSTFLYGTIEEEVHVSQPLGFEDPTFPDKVYKVEKALYGLHQAPRAWYETLSTYLIENGFRRGAIDKTLFIKKIKNDILLVQVYVDDIIFGSTKKSLSTEFEQLMHKRFQMSSMGELTFFLGLQVEQRADGIFLSQDKYVYDILQKFGYSSMKSVSTPIETHKPLTKDENGADVDVYLYRSMIRSLKYLTSFRPDIMFAVYACSRYQVQPKASYMHAVKRIFRYLKGQPTLGLLYPKDSPLDLIAYSDSDYAGASLDRKSTTRGYQFLGCRLVSWQCKKQTIVANSTTEAEYIAASNCCAQNLVSHSKTKHIEIRYHFIRDCYEKRLIEMAKIHTDNNVADLLTKAFNVTRFKYLIASIVFRKSMDLRMNGRCASDFSHSWVALHSDNKEYIVTEAYVRSKLQLANATGINNLPDADIYEGLTTLGCSTRSRSFDKQEPEIPQSQEPTFTTGPDEVTTTRLGVDVKGATTTTSGLDAWLDSGNIHESLLRSHDTPLHEGHTSGSVEDSEKLQELMVLVPELESKVNNLEKELKETKQTLGGAILTLVKKVKSLEVALKRKNKKAVISDFEDEEIEAYTSGEEQVEDISPTTLEAARTLSKVASQKAKEDISTSREEINSGFEDFSTGCLEVNTGTKPVSAPSRIPSPVKGHREGKAPMTEEENEEAARQIHLDALLAERIAKEEELSEQQKKRKVEVQEAAQYYTEENWDTIREKLESNAELVKILQGESVTGEDFAKRIVEMINQKKKLYAEQKAKAKRSKPMTRAQQRDTNEEARKKKKQIARKGIHIDKSAQEEEREAFVKDNVKDASSESEEGIDAIPTAMKPPKFYRLVMKKYGKNRPEEMYDSVLWGDLKTMYDPPLSEDAIWSLPHQ
ncbi:putative ribonuclease H-like domain-containing protein [Tanacetum coccineum]